MFYNDLKQKFTVPVLTSQKEFNVKRNYITLDKKTSAFGVSITPIALWIETALT